MVLGRGWRANQVLSGRRPEDLAGRDRRPGRRDRLRARRPWPGPWSAWSSRDKGRVPSTAPRSPACAAARSQARAAQRARPARLPGPAALARPGPDRRGDRRRGAADPRRHRRGQEIERRGSRPRWRRSAWTRRCWRRTPGQISGGQRQRVSIARALAVDPALLLCDEPVSALDASNRNYILRLLDELRDTLGLPIVIISHDLSSLAGIADRVVVLYRGRIVEDGPVGQVFTAPRHPYTALLMASAPSVKHDRPLSVHQLRRTSADPGAARPSAAGACVFAARCPFAVDACAVQQPPLDPVAEAERPLERGLPPARPSGRRWPGRGPPSQPDATARPRPPANRHASGRDQLHARRVHRHDRHQGPVGDQAQPPARSSTRTTSGGSPAPTRTPDSTGC